MQRFAHLSKVTNDVDQVAKRGRTLAILDICGTRFTRLDAVDPIFNVILGFRLLIESRILGSIPIARLGWRQSCCD